MAPSLYGTRDASKHKHKPISSSSSLGFSSNLSSLISSAKSTTSLAPTKSKVTTPSSKSSVFTSHNKNVNKRALADKQPNGDQQHKTSASIGRASESELHRSKRKMLEKTRLYNAMKRGEYLDQSGNEDSRHGGGLVDFDRKWASSHQDDQHNSDHSDSSDNSSDSEPSSNPRTESIQWTDEFGRTITGTPSQHRKHLRRQRIAAAAEAAFADISARPQEPTQLIYGDTIQSAAFNPDTVIQDRMNELAAKRDRSATPPPATHYDGEAEIRMKGQGFYGFSKDEEERKREMDGLEKERLETERRREERAQKLAERKKEVEERRKAVMEKRKERVEREVDSFLDGLGDVIAEGDAAGPAEEGDASVVRHTATEISKPNASS